MIDILIYIYFAGIVAGSVIEAVKFHHAIKILSSFGGFLFMLIDVLIHIGKLFVWPVTATLRLIQLLFLESAVDDFNEAMGDYNGYDQEEDNDENKTP